MAKKTLIGQKTAFIREQVRILSQPVEIPDEFREHTQVPDKVLDNAMKELNRILRHHNKSVYHDAGVRSVAEQIEGLYTGVIENVIEENQDGKIRVLDDLTNDKIIELLTDDFSASEQYADAVAHLRELRDRREAASAKLNRYRALQSQLAFLKNAKNSIQPSLATKTGPLAQELTRSRTLANSMAGEITRNKRQQQDDDVE